MSTVRALDRRGKGTVRFPILDDERYAERRVVCEVEWIDAAGVRRTCETRHHYRTHDLAARVVLRKIEQRQGEQFSAECKQRSSAVAARSMVIAKAPAASVATTPRGSAQMWRAEPATRPMSPAVILGNAWLIFVLTVTITAVMRAVWP